MSASSTDCQYVGGRFYYRLLDKLATVTGSYEGHGPDDPDGYYFEIDGESRRHWISSSSFATWFVRVYPFRPETAKKETDK